MARTDLVIPPHQRVLPVVVNNMRKLFLIWIIAFFTACSLKIYTYSNKAGRCEYTIINTGKNADPVVTGSICYNDSKSPKKLIGGIQMNEKLTAKTGVNGNFSFAVKAGEYKITALSMPYDTYETKTIKLKSGDSINIRFYLNLYTGSFPQSREPQK